MKLFVVFVAGVVFSLGLGIAGMTQPQKVIGFLDFAGAWDPSLAFVMVGAIGVNLLLFTLTVRRSRPMFAPRFGIPTRRDVDARLLGGAAFFGAGWGIAGFCPGPAVTSLSQGSSKILVFMAAMLGGMALFHAVQARTATWRARVAANQATAQTTDIRVNTPARSNEGTT